MKFFVQTFFIVSILFFALSVPVNAQKPGNFNIYAAGKLGYAGNFVTIKDTTNLKKKTDVLSSFNFGGAMGGQYYFLPPFGLRLEVEYLYRTNDSTKKESSFPTTVTLGIQTIMTNVYFDWYVQPKLVFYTQAGIGLSIISTEFESPIGGSTKYHNDFAWQVGIGTWYALTDHVIIDTNIKYASYTPRGGQNIDMSYLGGIEVLLSVRYLF